MGDDSLRIHDLRHTAASLAVASGANVKAIQQTLGHASAQMTLDRYAGLFDSHLHDVADRMELLVQVEESDSDVTGVQESQAPAPPLFTRPRQQGKTGGGPERFRTSDTRFRKPLLYPLSYGAGAAVCIRAGAQD